MPKQENDFLNMLRDAVGGAVAGLITGLVLGIAIQFISYIVLPIEFRDGPQVIAPFLGMGFGTLVGAILGGMVSLKK
ncbi:hypothetical protein HQ487_03925 [Candidatus Uhrbacteria bacterium]|nr:hypothetical protein [Candidatus Uhrbacteria bacterium]